MPSGWMPDARHDTRTAFLFAAERAPERTPHPARAHRTKRTRRTTLHRHHHAIARGRQHPPSRARARGGLLATTRGEDLS